MSRNETYLRPALDGFVSCGCSERGKQLRAFTMVELVISLGIMSVLAVGVSSAVVVSLRSVETSTSQSTRIRQATDVSNQIAAELSGAVEVTEKSANAVTLSVADRDSDGALEQIRYSWSGLQGDALLRRYNSETTATILRNVFAFNLAYDLMSVPIPVTGADRLLAGHHSSADLGTYRVRTLDWVAQSFRVSLPSGSNYWKITRAVIYCKQVGDSGGLLTFKVGSTSSDGRPGGAVFCQKTVPESDLQTSHAWYSVDLSYGNYFSQYATYCLIVTGNTSDVCELKFQSKNVNEPYYAFSVTNNGGSSWAVRTGQGLLFDVYGIPAGGSGSNQAEMRLGTVRWELQTGSDSAGRIYGGAQTINLPE